MLVPKLLVCAAALLLSLPPGSEARSHCVDGITIMGFAEHLLEEVSVRYPHLKRVQMDTLDPIPLGTFTVKTGNFVVQNKNAYLTGMNMAKLYKVDWDFRNNITHAKVYANVTMISDYESAGTFMYLPISSSGKLEVYGYDLEADVSFRFRTVICDNEEYLEIYDMKTTENFGLLQFNMKSNSGCSGYDAMVNAALNYNWQQFKSPGPAQVAKIVAQEMQFAINNLFRQVPYVELLKYI